MLMSFRPKGVQKLKKHSQSESKQQEEKKNNNFCQLDKYKFNRNILWGECQGLPKNKNKLVNKLKSTRTSTKLFNVFL